jgi:hypothetical protein
MAEINSMDITPSAQREKKLKEYKKTKLGQHVKLFKDIFLKPLLQSLRDEQKFQQQQQQQLKNVSSLF